MSILYFKKEQLYPIVTKKLMATEIVLDIGCGIRPQQMIRPRVHICYEPVEQYIKELQERIKEEFDRSYVILRGTWADALKTLPLKSVDTVFLLDVVEHIEKQDALRLLKETEEPQDYRLWFSLRWDFFLNVIQVEKMLGVSREVSGKIIYPVGILKTSMIHGTYL